MYNVLYEFIWTFVSLQDFLNVSQVLKIQEQAGLFWRNKWNVHNQSIPNIAMCVGWGGRTLVGMEQP